MINSQTTPEQLYKVVNAAYQVMDDMGKDGLSCCGLAKAKLRVALDPFIPRDDEFGFSLKDANKIIKECE